MPKEYIERGAATEILDRYAKTMTIHRDTVAAYEAMRDIVNIICPAADVVEVVRCKDCKYLKYGYQCYCPLGMNLTNNEDAYVLVDADNDFCSYGERRDEG